MAKKSNKPNVPVLAKKSEKQVVLSMDGFVLRWLGQWMALNGCPELTEEQAEKLLEDKEFREILLSDLFEFATETLDEAHKGRVFGLDVFVDVLNRLQIPHDGLLDDENHCEHGVDEDDCELCNPDEDDEPDDERTQAFDNIVREIELDDADEDDSDLGPMEDAPEQFDDQ